MENELINLKNQSNMNTYSKFCPNVFLAKCSCEYKKGDTIHVTTKYGKENDCIVFNLVYQKDNFYYYSIVRADGFNFQEFAKKKAEKLMNASNNAAAKSNKYYEASKEGKEFLSLGEPIKIGHHSEKRHRNLIERNWNRMGKSVEFSKISDDYKNRAAYWENKATVINLSMPESVEYFSYLLEKAKQHHEDLKNGNIERGHAFSLTCAKKEVNELTKKLLIAQKLWA